VSGPRLLDPDRARAIALAKLAARHHVVCGGSDAASTLEALRVRIEAARADGDVALTDALERGIEAASRVGGTSGPSR
jgi:hypothetical protein